MTKNRNIPQWQKSVFDNSVDKTSCVKTKPISTSMIKKIEQKFEIEQLRKEEKDPKINFKFNEVKKDLNCGMGFVNPFKSINQNSLGHSQSWRFKKQNKYNYYD